MQYPTSAKIYLSQFEGFGIAPVCRNGDAVFDEEETIKLSALHRIAEALCADIGVTVLSPAAFL